MNRRVGRQAWPRVTQLWATASGVVREAKQSMTSAADPRVEQRRPQPADDRQRLTAPKTNSLESHPQETNTRAPETVALNLSDLPRR